MRAHRVVIYTLSAALLFPPRSVAQGSAASFQAGVTPLQDLGQLLEVGARFSPRGTFGGDVSIDVYPRAFTAAVLAGVVDFSLATNLRLGPGVTIEPRVGASILGAVGTSGAVGVAGLNGGVGLVLRIDAGTTLRADYTFRELMVGDELYPAPSLTAGFVLHP